MAKTSCRENHRAGRTREYANTSNFAILLATTVCDLVMFHRFAILAFLLAWFPVNALGEKPAGADFSAAKAVLEAAVADRAFPGCVAEVGNADGSLWTAAVGKLAYDEPVKVTEETLYDLASLTKVVGTTGVVLCLVRDGKLRLDDPLVKHLPAFGEAAGAGERKQRGDVTIEHLLSHCSGLPAGRPLYQSARGYANVIALAAGTPLAAAPGAKTVYSDLGFMILGEAAARAGGKPLAELERELLFKPLGMSATTRVPPEALWPNVAPTERKAMAAAVHPEFWRGVVHDENARAADGLTGHAGLFATAGDVGRYAREWLRALAGTSEVFPRELARQFTTRRTAPQGTSRALGWDTPSGRSSSGSKMPHAFGHTGFTGTSVWIDPDRGIYVVLVANRVHPTRANQKIGAVRRELADAAASAGEFNRREH